VLHKHPNETSPQPDATAMNVLYGYKNGRVIREWGPYMCVPVLGRLRVHTQAVAVPAWCTSAQLQLGTSPCSNKQSWHNIIIHVNQEIFEIPVFWVTVVLAYKCNYELRIWPAVVLIQDTVWNFYVCIEVATLTPQKLLHGCFGHGCGVCPGYYGILFLRSGVNE
jgi:hypothetical protein